MDVFNGLDLGAYSSFRVLGKQIPELAAAMYGAAVAGGFLWVLFLAILVWRWQAASGRFPLGNLIKVLLIIAAVEALSYWLDRPRPDDAQDFFQKVVGHGFPNGPTFRAVLISALMWETTKPGWGRWLGFLGAVLYCVWVMMGQLVMHLGFLTDVLASLALALGIGLLSPRLCDLPPSEPQE
jgi:membrane-associated phospholipid phosphatase